VADPTDRDLLRLAAACAAASEGRFGPDDIVDLVRLALETGATPEEIVASTNLGELVLDLQLRPLGTLTVGEVVAESGLGWSSAEPFLAALGVPTDPAARLTDAEADVVRLLVGGAPGVLGEDASLQLARVTGNVTARLAETLVDAFRLRLEVPLRDAGTRYVEIVRQYSEIAQTLLPEFSRGLDALLRRQILVVARTMWSTDDERSAVTVQRTVGFVDLVGYTERTAAMTVRQLTDALLTFDRWTADVVARHGGSVVKTIGDEVLFVTSDTTDACRIARDLAEGSGSERPEVRIGLASGEMVSVFGDIYGPDVNLAARLVVAAEPSTAVVSASVRQAAPGFQFEALPPFVVKGIADPVVAYRLLSTLDTAG